MKLFVVFILWMAVAVSGQLPPDDFDDVDHAAEQSSQTHKTVRRSGSTTFSSKSSNSEVRNVGDTVAGLKLGDSEINMDTISGLVGNGRSDGKRVAAMSIGTDGLPVTGSDFTDKILNRRIGGISASLSPRGPLQLAQRASVNTGSKSTDRAIQGGFRIVQDASSISGGTTNEALGSTSNNRRTSGNRAPHARGGQ